MSEPGASAATASAATSHAPASAGRTRTPAVVWVLMAAMALLTTTWSLLTPPLLAPDETAHFSSALRLVDDFSWPAPGEARLPAFVDELAAERGLPDSERSTLGELSRAFPGDSDRLDQMTQHPPLYYLVAGRTMALLGGDDLRWDRALLIIRLLGAPIGAALVWLSWSTVRTLTRSPRTAIVAAAAVFVVPGLAQMLGVANNDSAAILIGAVLAWLAVRVLTGDRRPGILIALGVVFGLAGLAKGTLIVYGPLLVLAILFGAGRPPTWSRRLWQAAWPMLIALACGQWWWLRNLVLYGTLQPYGYLLGDGRWEPGTGPDLLEFIDHFWVVMSGTFWGWFGRVSAPLPVILVDFLMVTCLVLVSVGMFRFRSLIPRALLLATPIVISAVLMLRVSWGAYAETTEFRGMHGRYFYAVLVPIIALSALALRNLVRDGAARTVFGVGFVAVAAYMALFGLAVAYVSFYADDLWPQWRAGVGAWINDMSPAPAAVNLIVTGGAIVTLLIGCVLAGRRMLRDGSARGRLGADDAAPRLADADVRE